MTKITFSAVIFLGEFRQLEQLLCINYVVSRGKCSNCKKQVQIRISCAAFFDVCLFDLMLEFDR